MQQQTEQIIDREFDILCTLADAADWLTMQDLADSILDISPGPRCAHAYAVECVWRLMKRGYIEQKERQTILKTSLYQITRLGRRFLESTPAE